MAFTVIVGKKGSGKSYWAKKQLKKYLQAYKENNRLIVFDVNEEYTDFSPYPVIGTYQEFIQMLKENKFPIIFNPRRMRSEIEPIYEVLCEYPGYLLVIDEFHFFSSKYSKSSSLIELVRRQRHLHADLIGITQRIGDISLDVLSQADLLISFKQTLPRDFKVLEQYGITEADFENLEQFKYISREL